jgi:hypothetical protein
MAETVQLKFKSREVLDAYNSFLDTIRAQLPNIDEDFVMKLLIHNYKYKEERPKMRLEIIYAEDVNGRQKKYEIAAKTGRFGEVRENYILIIDGHFALQDIEELARDKQIQLIKGEIASY